MQRTFYAVTPVGMLIHYSLINKRAKFSRKTVHTVTPIDRKVPIDAWIWVKAIFGKSLFLSS
jgi:hypothetical protein